MINGFMSFRPTKRLFFHTLILLEPPTPRYLAELGGKAPEKIGPYDNALLDKRQANPQTNLRFTDDNRFVGSTPEIERLRPKSPPPHMQGRPRARGAAR